MKQFLEDTLHDLKKTWIKGIEYTFTVTCPCSAERHFLNLNNCLEHPTVECERSKKTIDTSKIKDKFTERSPVVGNYSLSDSITKRKTKQNQRKQMCASDKIRTYVMSPSSS